MVLVQILWKCFEYLRGMSDLHASGEKSEIYFGGVELSMQHAIMHAIPYRKRTFPCQYLRPPLSIKRLTHRLCQPLVERLSKKCAHGLLKIAHILANSHCYSLYLQELLVFGLWCSCNLSTLFT